MHLLISIPAAFLGSMLGSAARGGVAVARARLEAGGRNEAAAGEEADTINITGSPVAALAGGLVGGLMGPGTAFWVGAVLGAAGMERFDAKVLGAVGIDMDALVARAMEKAKEARQGMSGETTPDGPEQGGAD